MTKGYDPEFIGHDIKIQLPDPEKFRDPLKQSVLKKQELKEGVYSEHVHFTIVMNKKTRQLIYAAYNIDQKLIKSLQGRGETDWTKDEAIGSVNQLGDEYYEDPERKIYKCGEPTDGTQKIPNPYDRGHMVTRSTNMWGSEADDADKAGKATFVYANCSLQHKNLNRDEWKAIELDIVRNFQDNTNKKLSLFTGPIYGHLDRHINLSDDDSARVPSGFFKIICYHRKNVSESKELGVLAFAVFQDNKVLRDMNGAATIKTNCEYQVTICDIQDWTGIVFDGQLALANPLFYSDLGETRDNIPYLPRCIPMCGAETIVSCSGDPCRKTMPLKERPIVINSAMINPEGNEPGSEWISLHNRSNEEAPIGGWLLVDGRGKEAILPSSIGAGESIALKGDAMGEISLTNAGGSLMLFNDEDCIVDYVTWTKSQVRQLEEGFAFLFEQEAS